MSEHDSDKPEKSKPELPEDKPDTDAPVENDGNIEKAEFVAANDPEPQGADRTMISDMPERSRPLAVVETTVISDQATTALPEVRLIETGTLINNNYRILSLISAGGMGEVYRAENVFTGDPVAVKVILPNLAQDETVLDMFRREARVLVQLRDEAIVRYHNFVLDAGLGRYCLIMEFVEGRHLGTRLKEEGPLPDTAALSLMRRLAGGLHRAHDRGVTHRDLSPDNVILRDDKIEEAVLIDFGIARSTELGDGLVGRFAGKFKYIAPEQLGHAGGEIGPYTDIYGLALLMAAVARGKPLDMGDSVVSASAARLAIPDLTGVSHRIFPLLQHMLEPDPQRRPADMGAVLRIMGDPALLPAQYRYPLWGNTQQAVEGEDKPGSFPSFGDGTGTGGASDSPFAVAPGVYASAAPVEQETTAKTGRSGLVIGAIAAVILMAAGGLWWFMRQPAETVQPPEEVVQTPLELTERDTSTREGFLASQPLPPCSFADRIATGANAGMIAVLRNKKPDLTDVLAAYEGKFNVRPSVVETRIAEAHCPVIDFLGIVSGRPAAAPELNATMTAADTGIQLVGDVKPGANRNLWLFLVSPQGGIYDLTGQSTETPEGRSFGVGISGQADANNDIASYLLVALTTDEPITAVAASPPGTAASELLPRVLEELQGKGETPTVSVVPLIVEKKPESIEETPDEMVE